MTQLDPENPQEVDEALRLIGQFIVNFSAYVNYLEHGIGAVIDGPVATYQIVGSLTSAMPADRLRVHFLAATALGRTPSVEEEEIRKHLNKRGQQLTEDRNALVHGAWYFSNPTGVDAPEGLPSFEPSLLWTRTTKQGSKLRSVLSSREELQGLVDEATEVGSLFWGYQTGLMAERLPDLPSVTDRLGFVDRRLVRRDLTGWTPPQATP